MRIIVRPAPDDVGREVGVDILIIGAVQGTGESTFPLRNYKMAE